MPHLSTYVGLADHSEKSLADSFRASGGVRAVSGPASSISDRPTRGKIRAPAPRAAASLMCGSSW